MGAEAFTAPKVLAYVRSTVRESPLQQRIRAECEAEELPNVLRESGPVLALLAALAPGGRALEVGCLLGYSGLWILDGLGPEGRLETIEMEDAFAERALAHFAEAGYEKRATVHRGLALDVLPTLPDASYDLVFLDAAKEEYLDYLGHALRLLRPGGLVVADNVLWSGKVADDRARDADTEGLRQYVKAALAHPRLRTAVLPVGDGLAVSRVR
ncbi:MAG TPA: O-methyltransferase [Candidatus Thermoplasmatota archaeon]|nr:O-methyltransferase [Candidatus Thermoplasmatota archaeon]